MSDIRAKANALAEEFLEKAKSLHANVELIKVLKSRTYKIGKANVLVRAATVGKTGRFFYGLNYLTAEEMNNLDNPFVAFICGSHDKTLIIPAKVLFRYLPEISIDRNGEYKIVIDKDLNITLKGNNNRLNCKEYVNAWHLLLQPFAITQSNTTVEESLHSIIQGRLIEIGNIRGFKTFCPDKSKKFNDKRLGELITLNRCPELQFSDYDLLRKIDVIWFKEKGKHLIPSNAFEVEISTGTWSGVGRLATLIAYGDVSLYVVSNDLKKFNQVMNTFDDYQNRYKHVISADLGDLYSAEKNLRHLRIEIGL